MRIRERLGSWPLLRQLGGDPLGLGPALPQGGRVQGAGDQPPARDQGHRTDHPTQLIPTLQAMRGSISMPHEP